MDNADLFNIISWCSRSFSIYRCGERRVTKRDRRRSRHKLEFRPVPLSLTSDFVEGISDTCSRHFICKLIEPRHSTLHPSSQFRRLQMVGRLNRAVQEVRDNDSWFELANCGMVEDPEKQLDWRRSECTCLWNYELIHLSRNLGLLFI